MVGPSRPIAPGAADLKRPMGRPKENQIQGKENETRRKEMKASRKDSKVRRKEMKPSN
jgi:hypothetical protein